MKHLEFSQIEILMNIKYVMECVSKTLKTSDITQEIARAFGHHLMDTGKHKDAGISESA